MIDNDELLEEACSARRAYYGVRGAHAGLLSEQSPDLASDPYRKDFVGIARMCADNGIKASDFIMVAANFYIGQDRKPELPRDFMNAALMERYSTLGHGIDPTPPEDRWKMQETRLRSVARTIGPNFDVVNWMLRAAGLESWFRVAWPYGDNAVKKFYGAAAHAEMVQDPRLTSLLRRVRPVVVEELEEEFGKLYGGGE